MKIVVDGVELIVRQTITKRNNYVKVKRVVGRNRKSMTNITGGVETEIPRDDPCALIRILKQVAALQTVRCTCDYRYGFSDHAEHCLSIHVAEEYRDED